MVEVICDTNFLIHLATNRIINIDRLDVEIGQLTFVVPQVVVNELIALSKDSSKKDNVNSTLDYIKKFKKIPINGTFADKELVDFVSKNNTIIATMDKNLKKEIKKQGGSIISFSKNKIILES